jgi:hypothetical protein
MKVPFNFAFSAFAARTRAFADAALQQDMRDEHGRLKFVLLILRLLPAAVSINAQLAAPAMAAGDPVPFSYDELDRGLRERGEEIPAYQPRPAGERHADYGRRHDGQRKLLLSEIEFLTLVIKSLGPQVPLGVVYAGSAPGTHLKALIWMFPQVRRWVFVDPNHPLGQFSVTRGAMEDHAQMLWNLLEGHRTQAQFMAIHGEICSRVEVVREYATTPMVQKICNDLRTRHQCVPLLISDIRTSYDTASETEAEINAKVRADMRLQQEWHKFAVPFATMVKFRLDYVSGQVEHLSEYMKGELYLQAWARPNSSETRLVVFDGRASPGDPLVPWQYDARRYQDVMYYFNREIREKKCVRYEARRELGILGAFQATVEHDDELWGLLEARGLTGEHGLSKLFDIVLDDAKKTRGQFEDVPEQAPEPVPVHSEYVELAHRKPRANDAATASAAVETSVCALFDDVAFYNEDLVKRFFNAAGDDAAAFAAALRTYTGGRNFWKDGTPLSAWPRLPLSWCAAQTGKLEILKVLVSDFGFAVDAVGSKNQTSLLHDAAYYCQTEVVRWLLTHESVRRHLTTKSRPNGGAYEQETPLEAARKAPDNYRKYHSDTPGEKFMDQFRAWRDAETTPDWGPIIEMLEHAAAVPPSLTYQLRLRF